MSWRVKLLLNLTLLFSIPYAKAQELTLPTPRAVIYPGDTLTEDMLEDRTASSSSLSQSYVTSRAALIGKIARRTLLPGQPIAASVVDQPRLVTIDAQVKIIYSEGGMVIVAFGVAQQAGAAGDLVRVRNAESGLYVVGRVQNDGSIRVGET